MFRRTFLSILAVIGLGGAAHAAVVGPSIVDSAAEILSYNPATSSTPSAFSAVSFNPVATPSVIPAPDFALVISTLGNDVALTVEDASFNTILSATGTSFSAGSSGISALLTTVFDATGLFGPRLLVNLNVANFDASVPLFEPTLAELVIENAPAAVVPLPAAAPLMAGGLVLLWGMKRRRSGS